MTTAQPGTGIQRTSAGTVPLAIATAPLVAFVVAVVTGYVEPMFANPPSLLGSPVGMYLLVAAGLLTALGMVIVARSHRPLARAAAISACTVPALLLVVLGPPAIVLLVALG